MNTAEVIDKWAVKVNDALNAYGPQAHDLMLWMGRLGAFKQLIGPVIGLLFGLMILGVAGYLLLSFFRFTKTVRPDHHVDYDAYKKWDRRHEEQGARLFFGSAFTVVGFFISIPCLIEACNIYAWVGLFHPEVWLVAKALGL